MLVKVLALVLVQEQVLVLVLVQEPVLVLVQEQVLVLVQEQVLVLAGAGAGAGTGAGAGAGAGAGSCIKIARPAICRSGSWLQESVLHPYAPVDKPVDHVCQGLCHNQAWLMVRNLSYS